MPLINSMVLLRLFIVMLFCTFLTVNNFLVLLVKNSSTETLKFLNLSDFLSAPFLWRVVVFTIPFIFTRWSLPDLCTDDLDQRFNWVYWNNDLQWISGFCAWHLTFQTNQPTELAGVTADMSRNIPQHITSTKKTWKKNKISKILRHLRRCYGNRIKHSK